MKLNGIISIAGKPGLSKIITQSKNGIIVESLMDGKRFPVLGNQRVSSLEDISIYTYDEDVLLADVFEKIYDKENGKKCLSHKSSAAELKEFMHAILPNFDEDRVYHSDLKKIAQWYNLLVDKGLLKKEEKKKSKEPEAKSEEKKKTKKSPAKSSQPKAKSTSKKPSGAAKPKPSAPRKAK